MTRLSGLIPLCCGRRTPQSAKTVFVRFLNRPPACVTGVHIRARAGRLTRESRRKRGYIKMKRKLAGLFAALLLFSCGEPGALAAGQSFRDLPSTHWAYAEITRAVSHGIMNGLGDG
ncbi:MAG: S-layer homology domain-containing protein, partial [Oscillibacter sp.]|nr:S-layer homology domain-containing protein [Oscillibacter sp.]